MDIAIKIFLILHFIGLAGIIGSWLAVIKEPRVGSHRLHPRDRPPRGGAHHGTRRRDAARGHPHDRRRHLRPILQVVTGLALVGLREAQDVVEVNHMKIGIKLLVALAVLVVAFIGLRKEKQNPGSTATLAHVAGGLGILNVIIAVAWT